MVVFIINGKAGAGKDTFVDLVCKAYEDRVATPGYVGNISTVDRVKQAAIILGWNGKKDPLSRKFLADLKELSTNYNDFPTMSCCNFAEQSEKNHKLDILFIHCREPENITNIKNRLVSINRMTCFTLCVERDVEAVNTNRADMSTEDYEYDYYIDNTRSLEDLEMIAKKFVDYIITYQYRKLLDKERFYIKDNEVVIEELETTE